MWPTVLDIYIDGVINAMSDEDFAFLVTHLDMLDIPTYDALSSAGGDPFYDLTHTRRS